MCDSAEANWIWIVRDRSTGKPVESADGYVYYFAEEPQAEELARTRGGRDLDVVQVREPGA